MSHAQVQGREAGSKHRAHVDDLEHVEAHEGGEDKGLAVHRRQGHVVLGMRHNEVNEDD